MLRKSLVDRVAPLLPTDSHRRLLELLVFRPSYWLGLFGLVFLLIARRFSDFKVGLIDSKRIGHFAGDLAIRMAQASQEKLPAKTLYWVAGNVSNKFLFDIMKRNLWCHPIAGYIALLAPYLRGSSDWFLPSPKWGSGSRDVEGIISRTGFSAQFLPPENQFAYNWLRRTGWIDGQKIVCVMVRDSEFLRSENPSDNHDYRDSDVQTFVPAMEWLANDGALVLRMGRTMAQPLDSSHPNIVDYAFHPERSDFLDVWLFANCDLCVTTGTGPDQIAVAYGKPLVCINYLPLTLALTSADVVTAGKRLYSESGERLSLEEHLHADLTKTKDYREAGIVIKDLSSEEILKIVMERWDAIQSAPHRTAEDTALRFRFIEALKSGSRADRHGYIHPGANLSKAWVKELLEETEKLRD